MAPRKRPSLVLEDDDAGQEETIHTESVSSSLRQGPSKKQRLTNLSGVDRIRESSPPSDTEDYNVQATQYAERQSRTAQMDNRPADNGIIETITCINFMCHAYLEIPLGPLINFVVGRNGSGKSAILTALAICLGGKASSTNRGQSLKSFIMTGQETATLTVKIKNGGESAFQHEIYGDRIIVERQFSRSGSSGFKLKSSTGRIISTKKSILDDICDYFALQIDNPMNVLTQDMARQFLNNSNPYDKYRFFMKGTQLEMLDADYLQIEQSVDIIEQGSELQERDLRELEEKTRKARQLLHLSQKQDHLRDKIAQLGRQMAWAQVEEQERALQLCEMNVRRSADAIRDAERNVNDVGQHHDLAQQLFESAFGAVTQLEEDIEPLLREGEQKNAMHDDRRANALDIHSQQRQIQAKIKEARQTKFKTEANIAEEHRRLEDLNGGSHTRRLEEIDEKRQEVDDAKRALLDHDGQLRDLHHAKRLADEAHQESRKPVELKKREVERCNQELENLMRDRGQRHGAYHQNLPRLLRAIQEDNGFQNKPVGPIGHHVRLLKPKWSSVLEKTLGGSLEGFIVTSKADQSRLSALSRRISCPCQILIGQPQAIARLNEPDSKFDTALRVLDIDNELVRNQLIIGQGIDQTILVEDLIEAHRLMDGERLVNVKQCLSIQKTNRAAGARTAYGFGAALSETYVPPWQGSPRMRTDIEFQMNNKREVLNDLKAEFTQLENRRREKQQAELQAGQAIIRHQRRSGELKLVLQRAQATLEGLQDALEQDAVEEGRLDELKRILEEAVDEVSTYEAQYQDSVLEADKAKEEMEHAKSELQEVKVSIEEARYKIRKAQSKTAKHESEKHEAAAAKNKATEIVLRLERKKREAEQDRDDKAKTVDEFIGEASKISEREPVPPGETGDTLDKKLAKLNKDIQRAEQQIGGSRSEIAAIAQRALKEYQYAERQFQDLKSLAQLLKSSLLTRRDRWKMFQKCITARARIQFVYLLSERGFKGKLLANHKERKLDIHVEPSGNDSQHHVSSKGGANSSGASNTHSLSGGEKSFSTTCLLLSLWDAMGAPIRCLDEFDVFMDSVNRTVSMKMMIGAARRSVGKQFVFITPGSMDAVPEAPDVKVTKMRDPERGAQPIRFPAQANGIGSGVGGARAVEVM